MPKFLALGALLLFSNISVRAELNLADPAKHPFVDPKGGREGREHVGQEVNSVRVYEFYSRQADYYMALPGAEVPEILPAFPGLDAGQFGHWGKFNKNEHKDDRWNSMDVGTVVGVPLHAGKLKVEKAVNVRLGEEGDLAACFDPQTLTYPVIWHSGEGHRFLKFGDWRWGLAGNSNQGGASYFRLDPPPALAKSAVYRGYRRYGKRVVFDYDLNGKPVFDEPRAVATGGGDQVPGFARNVRFVEGCAGARVPITRISKDAMTGVLVDARLDGESVELEHADDGTITAIVPAKAEPCTLYIALWKGDAHLINAVKWDFVRDSKIADPKPAQQWPETITLAGKRAADDAPYVVDTLPVPLTNPYRSTMMFSGFAFLPDGSALVSTLMGDISRVTGIDDELKAVTWKRFAAGISIPFGIEVVDGEIFVCGKQQITRLHDTDNDGEADFYENWANGYLDDHGHPHIYGLGMDPAGNAHFIREFDIARIDAQTRQWKSFAKGVRNCMGFGSGQLDGKFTVLVAPQEGDWTPASMIIRPREGAFYGFDPKASKLPSVGLPLCYIPRGVDNSTGGFVFMDSDRWGPLGHSVIGLSYGSGSHYAVLYDGSGPNGQAATVPLDGDFIAGPVRGAASPKDGQLYLVGTEGWGNYAHADGCLQRVRYTGKSIHTPRGFKIHQNGVRIDFTSELDPATAGDVKNFFAQQWNYEYAKRYGSPEFSAKNPSQLGHDRLKITSTQLLPDGRSIFLEIPDIEPVMQMHLRMHLKTKGGIVFKSDLFPTIVELAEPFTFDGMQEIPGGKPVLLRPRIRGQKKAVATLADQGPPDESWAAATRIEVKTIDGLRFDQTQLKAKPGEKIAFTLRNVDVMPHNWVLLEPEAKSLVGEAAFKMLNDPAALDKSYIPTEHQDRVIAHTAVISPKAHQTIYFQAPKKPGDYPYICTFPGHWQIMQGVLRVVE